MSECLITMICALAGYAVFLASLFAIDANWSEAIIVDPLLPGAEQRARSIV